MYSKKVLDHFYNPHNQGVINDADGIGEVGNPVCGDIMKIYLKIKKNKNNEEIIDDIKFETLGCGAAIATSSMLTDMVKGKTIKEALKIKNIDIADSLGGLPNPKLHCSVLARRGLLAAIEDYRKSIKE